MTDADRHARAVALFLDALDQPPETRETWLEHACDDATLRHEARALLGAHAETQGFLDHPLLARPPAEEDVAEADAHVRGRRVGPWRIERRLGEGGMGVVYRAARADGLYDRTVALKLLAPSALLASGDVLARRLAAERQILAHLEHEGIARLYDGGVTDDGLPYLALELVDGEPITAYCDRRDLGAAPRAALFTRACDAVAYAHRSLVVHRDLKPAHVLVVEGEAGAEAAVKLLDFGVSALLGDPGGDGPVLPTVPRALTPAYAAPEQVRGEPVTTAADVYALGVVLYELLAGQRPYDLAGKTAREVERLVAEVEPPPPSAVAPAGRARALRGDLDTIVMKALAKEPARRYASASDLADDLRRHLAGRPVEARPATARYRAGRFVRRHRLGVAAGALVALALVGGTGVALWQARVARLEAAKAEAVNTFLIGLLGAANPHEDGRDVRVASLLDRAAADLDTSFAGQPDLEAAARHTLGVSYRELGLYDEAAAQLRRALALRERLHGPRHADVAKTQHALALTHQERGDFGTADSLYTLALATSRARFGERSTRVSTLLNDLGHLRGETGDLDGAEAFYRQSLAIEEHLLAPDDPDFLIGLGNLAVTLADQGESDEAARLFERQLTTLRAARPNADESIGNALANLGSVRYDQGRGEEAAALQTEAVARFRRALGDDHDYVGFALNNLGSTLGALGRHDEAEAALRESVAIYEAALSTDHPNVGYPLVNLARTLRSRGRLDEAEPAARRAVALFRAGFGPEHFAVGRGLDALGEILMDQGRAADAADAFQEALAVQEAALPPGHPARAATESRLGAALAALGRTEEAAPLLQRGYDALLERLGPDHAQTQQARERLRAFRAAAGRAAP